MTGKTIFQYLEDYRITQGILLLQTDRYSITQIAYLVGFGNPGRFSAAFARRTASTPRQFRRELRNGSQVRIENFPSRKKPDVAQNRTDIDG